MSFHISKRLLSVCGLKAYETTYATNLRQASEKSRTKSLFSYLFFRLFPQKRSMTFILSLKKARRTT